MLPDGELVELGGASTEPVGPDWVGMFCGSEGFVRQSRVEVTLRLVPIAESTRTSLAVYDSLEARRATRSPRSSERGLLPVAMEIMGRTGDRGPPRRRSSRNYPKGAALLIVELEGERETVGADAAKLDLLAGAVRGRGGDLDRGLLRPGR